jgi:arylsulfatase A-like enzyme
MKCAMTNSCLCVLTLYSVLAMFCGYSPLADDRKGNIESVPSVADTLQGESLGWKNLSHTLVLVTLDTTRADHIGCYGYFRDTTPFLDSLASRGTKFLRAYSAMNSTVPSHASIMTSLYPMEHGVISNELVLGDDVVTLAELLRETGYITTAFVATRQFGPANVNQGFTHFDELESLPRFAVRYRPARDTIQAALDYIATVDTDKKLFVWIHLFDPHRPFGPPDTHLKFFTSQTDTPEERNAFAQQLLYDRHIEFDTWKGIPNYLVDVFNNYDAELRFADAELRRFGDAMVASGRDPLWIICADHGEGLGSHGYDAHQDLIYEEQIHVPLIVVLPKKANAAFNASSSHVVELVDVAPTLIEFAGSQWPQSSEIRGQSLSPLILAESNGLYKKNAAFSARQSYYWVEPGSQTSTSSYYENAERYALVTADHKIIISIGEKKLQKTEFYSLHRDPFELTNIANLGGDVEERHLAAIRQIIEFVTSRSKVDYSTTVDDAAKEELKSLGYL